MLSKKQVIAGAFYSHYISLAPNIEVHKSIRKNTRNMLKFLLAIPASKRKYRYAVGKWSIQEMLQHIIDTERVFSYRAVTIARRDNTPLPGFDENNWAKSANVNPRKWSELIEEFSALRKSIELLFKNLSEKDLLFKGTTSNYPANALAFGYIITGHAQHHINILKERYLNPKNKS
jgi:hypothetical protein